MTPAPKRADCAHLRILPRDDRVAQLEKLEAQINAAMNEERGDMQEYPDKNGRAPTLFRYTGYDGVCTAHSIPRDRLTPHVRALLWELAEAIEDAGRVR